MFSDSFEQQLCGEVGVLSLTLSRRLPSTHGWPGIIYWWAQLSISYVLGLWGGTWINGGSLVPLMQGVWASQRVLASAGGHTADQEGTEAVLCGFTFQTAPRRSSLSTAVLNVNLIVQWGAVLRRRASQLAEWLHAKCLFKTFSQRLCKNVSQEWNSSQMLWMCGPTVQWEIPLNVKCRDMEAGCLLYWNRCTLFFTFAHYTVSLTALLRSMTAIRLPMIGYFYLLQFHRCYQIADNAYIHTILRQ